MAGIGDDELPEGYPPAAGSVWMVRSALVVVPLAEPTGDNPSVPLQLGNGPLGFFAAARCARTGRPLIIVNCGRVGAKAAWWVPGAPEGLFNIAVTRSQAALAVPGALLKGYIQFDGLNDAPDAVPTWESSWATAWPAIKAALGDAPVYGVRYPQSPPNGGNWQSHAAVRESMLAAPFFDAVVDAPEGPWVEEPAHVHLDTPANVSIGDILAMTTPD